MSLSKEILEALHLEPGETVLEHWSFEHWTCVLTNHRIALLSPHHLLAHPHHEVNWNEALQEIGTLEVQPRGGYGPPVAYATVSTASMPGKFADRGVLVGTSDPTRAEHSGGEYAVHVDETVVFAGGPEAASQTRDRIERAAESRRQELASAAGPGAAGPLARPAQGPA